MPAAITPNLDTTHGSMTRRVLRLGLPVLVVQATFFLVGFSDTVVTGRYLDEDALAAVTVANYLLWFLDTLLTIVSIGATAVVARSVGAGDWGAANRACGQAMLMALALGVVALAIGWPAAPFLTRMLNLQGSVHAQATTFLRIVLIATPLVAATTAGIACLQGAADTRTGMYVFFMVDAVNIALTWACARGVGPMPSLGLPGVAAGTAIAEGLGGAVILVVLTLGRSNLKLGWKRLRFERPEAARIMHVSLPAMGESATNIVGQLWFLALINRLGSTATAAHGVAIRCEAVAFLTVYAFSVPASTLVGQYLGASRPDLAARAGRTAWALAVGVVGVLGVFVYLGADVMFDLFLGGRQPHVAAAGVPVLRIVAFALPALATLNVVNGALRGAGDTRTPLAFTVVGYACARIPLTYWFATPVAQGGLGWGLEGAWLAMFADLHIRGALSAVRLLQGGWKHVRV